MTFRALPQHLHELALVAIEHFSREYGIPRGRFVIEGELQADIGYRPTIYAKKQDHTFVAIEVSEDPRPSNIEALILGCKNKFVPLKLWIVVPSGAVDALKPADLHFFRENGVG